MERFVEPEVVELTGQVTETTVDFLKSFFAANFGLSIIFAGMLKFLWGMINTLQIIVLTVLFRLDTPYNADTFMVSILKLCSMDAESLDAVFEEMFHFREMDPF